MHESLSELLESFSQGRISLDEALGRIKVLSYRTVGEVAKLDTCRAHRIGIPEAILAEGKDKTDLLAISLAHLEATGSVIITRVSKEQLELLRSAKLPAEVAWCITPGQEPLSSDLLLAAPNLEKLASWQQVQLTSP